MLHSETGIVAHGSPSRLPVFDCAAGVFEVRPRYARLPFSCGRLHCCAPAKESVDFVILDFEIQRRCDLGRCVLPFPPQESEERRGRDRDEEREFAPDRNEQTETNKASTRDVKRRKRGRKKQENYKEIRRKDRGKPE
eukprot:2973250-Pleurochrysis_carterae.AAC.1